MQPITIENKKKMRNNMSDFWSGFAVGLMSTGLVLLLVSLYISLFSPLWAMHPNDALNSKEWRIATVKTIFQGDTRTTYKFVPVEDYGKKK